MEDHSEVRGGQADGISGTGGQGAEGETGTRHLCLIQTPFPEQPRSVLGCSAFLCSAQICATSRVAPFDQP